MLHESEVERVETTKICRLCLSERDSRCRIFRIDSQIMQKIQTCCALRVYQNDGLPDAVCQECLTTLDSFVSFRARCEENDRLLREGVLDAKPIKREIDDPIEIKTEDDPDRAEPIDPGDPIGPPPKRPRKKRRRVKDEPKEAHARAALCPFCGKTFTKPSALNCHIRIHTAEKTLTCDKCDKRFRELWQLKEHESTHLETKEFPCAECGKLFRTKNGVKKHTDGVHRKCRVVSCKLCNKNLANLASLRGHMKIHTGEKTFACDLCEKKFAFKNSLIIHLRCHTGEKPYKCKYCDSRFAALKTITEHERLHTGETPFLCPICSKGFAQKSNMKSHFRNNHKGVELA